MDIEGLRYFSFLEVIKTISNNFKIVLANYMSSFFDVLVDVRFFVRREMLINSLFKPSSCFSNICVGTLITLKLVYQIVFVVLSILSLREKKEDSLRLVKTSRGCTFGTNFCKQDRKRLVRLLPCGPA